MSWWFLLVQASDAAALLRNHYSNDEQRLHVLRRNLVDLQGTPFGSELYRILVSCIQTILQGWEVSQQQHDNFMVLIEDSQFCDAAYHVAAAFNYY